MVAKQLLRVAATRPGARIKMLIEHSDPRDDEPANALQRRRDAIQALVARTAEAGGGAVHKPHRKHRKAVHLTAPDVSGVVTVKPKRKRRPMDVATADRSTSARGGGGEN